MEKENNKMHLRISLLVGIIFSLAIGFCGCEPEIVDENGNGTEGSGIDINENFGNIVFDFPLPVSAIPEDRIHRINLSVAKDAHSLYSGYFLQSANVSDLLSTYSFKLEDGEYYFQAGITCSAAGDTCLWGGFPGGQWGTRWVSGTIEVNKGESLYKNLIFTN
jgi:hypothetical protein